MPPVTMTGVSASASSPSSTPSRTISKAFAGGKKVRSRQREDGHLDAGSARQSARSLPARFSTSMRPRTGRRLQHNRAQNDRALNGLLPESVDAEKVSDGAITASTLAPSSVPQSVPWPPVMDAPPITTAEIALSSRPVPALLCTCVKRTESSSAAIPVSAPIRMNTPNDTAATGMPASRADSRCDPTA